MIDVLRIAHLRIAPQEGNLEVGNCEGNHLNGLINSSAKNGNATNPFNHSLRGLTSMLIRDCSVFMSIR